MPTILCDIKDLNLLLGKELTISEWNKFSDLFKGEIKSFDSETGELKIELQDTNRPDLWSVEGIARQVSFKLNPDINDYSWIDSIHLVSPDRVLKVDEELKDIRPFVAGIAIKNVDVSENTLRALIQTQEKIAEHLGRHRETLSIGIYDLNAIAFPVRYAAVEKSGISFVPLGFDEAMTPSEILEKHPKGIQYRHLLEKFKKVPILIDAENNVLSFPPIINSRLSGEVHIGRKDLFIEATGTNLQQIIMALNIFAFNMSDRGASIASVEVQYPFQTQFGPKITMPYFFKRKSKISTKDVFDILGYNILPDKIASVLKQYGYKANQSNNQVHVVMPPWRNDLIHKVDVIEDIAISLGYESFQPMMPIHYTIGTLDKSTLLADRVRNIVLAFGFEEIISNILCNKIEFTVAMRDPKREIVEIENPMTEKFNALRDRIIPSLLQVERESSQAMYPHKIFEVGEITCFNKERNTGCATEQHIALMIADKDSELAGVYSYLQHLVYQLDFNIKLKAYDNPAFLPGRSGKIIANEREIGWIGEIHPEILEYYKITMPCSVFELNLFAVENVMGN